MCVVSVLSAVCLPHGVDCWLTMQPGITASVVYRDQVLFTKGLGMINKKEPNTPPQGDTIFRIGSVSKVFAVS